MGHAVKRTYAVAFLDSLVRTVLSENVPMAHLGSLSLTAKPRSAQPPALLVAVTDTLCALQRVSATKTLVNANASRATLALPALGKNAQKVARVMAAVSQTSRHSRTTNMRMPL